MGPPASRLSRTLALAALLAPGAALANGFALDIQGLFSNGTATAGAAATHDPAGQLANPAILASLEGLQVVVGGQLISPRSPFTNRDTTLLQGAAATPGANADGGKTGGAPWVFASYRLRPDLALGFSFYAPFGQSTDFGGRGSAFYGRYQGNESTIESLAFGPAVAWRPVDGVAVGVSAAARRDHAVLGQAFDLGSMCVGAQRAAGADPATAQETCAAGGLVPGASDGYGRFTATGWGWTATAGVTIEPARGTLLGAAYRHESTSTVKGRQSFDVNASTFLNSSGLYAIRGEPATRLELPLPDFMTVSLQQQLGDSFQLLAAFQYTLWSRFDDLVLEPTDPANGVALTSRQGFRNAFRVAGAGVYTLGPGLDLFAGVAFEQSPITTRYRQVTLPERDALIAGAGVETRLYRGLSAGACYQRVQMLGASRIDQADAFGGRVVGSVEGSANVGVLQLTWRS